MSVKNIILDVNKSFSTEIYIGINSIKEANISDDISSKKVFFIVDEVVYNLYQNVIDDLLGISNSFEFIKIKAGESTKSLRYFVHLSNNMLKMSPKKSDIVIAIGGGTITDLVGFLSQICLRGMPLILIPTTLLAQVDAAIGGKNGLNFGFQKNKIGGFYHPYKVICDLSFLSTLEEGELKNGIAEIVKIFSISDSSTLWDFHSNSKSIYKSNSDHLLNKYVREAISRKIQLLILDPFESSSKRLLNFGHTFAHTLEELSEFKLKHGEAVFIGMLIETKLGTMIGITPKHVYQSIYEVISEFIVPESFDFNFTKERLLMSIQNVRNSRCGSLNIVLLKDLAHGIIYDDVPDEYLLRATESVIKKTIR